MWRHNLIYTPYTPHPNIDAIALTSVCFLPPGGLQMCKHRKYIGPWQRLFPNRGRTSVRVAIDHMSRHFQQIWHVLSGYLHMANVTVHEPLYPSEYFIICVSVYICQLVVPMGRGIECKAKGGEFIIKIKLKNDDNWVINPLKYRVDTALMSLVPNHICESLPCHLSFSMKNSRHMTRTPKHASKMQGNVHICSRVNKSHQEKCKTQCHLCPDATSADSICLAVSEQTYGHENHSGVAAITNPQVCPIGPNKQVLSSLQQTYALPNHVISCELVSAPRAIHPLHWMSRQGKRPGRVMICE